MERENGNRLSPALFQNHPAVACSNKGGRQIEAENRADFHAVQLVLSAQEVGVVAIPVVRLQPELQSRRTGLAPKRLAQVAVRWRKEVRFPGA